MSEFDAGRLRAEIERMRTFTLGTDFTPVVEKDEVIRIVDRLTACPDCRHAMAAHTSVTNDGCLVDDCLCERMDDGAEDEGDECDGWCAARESDQP